MFVRTSSEFEANITSVERIKEYIELKQEPRWVNESERPDEAWPFKGNIKILPPSPLQKILSLQH